MAERQALLIAAGLHLALLLALSLGLARLPDMSSDPDVTPVEFLTITDEPTASEEPKPSLDAAPRETGAPPEEVKAEPTPEPPAPPVVASKPAPTPDEAPQDAVAEEVKKSPPPKPKAQPKTKQAPEKGQNAALIDKNKKEAPVRPRDVSDFAKAIEQAIPKSAKLSAIQAATLEQAIRSQIAPCWNPPTGGADVQNMTAVLRIRLNADGSVASPPEFVSQTGATGGNQAYARAFVETARRAVLRCAPLQLPADLYSHWREFELNFDPRLMT